MRGVQHRVECSQPEPVQVPIESPRYVMWRCPECKRAALIGKEPAP